MRQLGRQGCRAGWGGDLDGGNAIEHEGGGVFNEGIDALLQHIETLVELVVDGFEAECVGLCHLGKTRLELDDALW